MQALTLFIFTGFYLSEKRARKDLKLALISHCFSAVFQEQWQWKELSWLAVVLLRGWQNPIRDETGNCPSGVD